MLHEQLLFYDSLCPSPSRQASSLGMSLRSSALRILGLTSSLLHSLSLHMCSRKRAFLTHWVKVLEEQESYQSHWCSTVKSLRSIQVFPEETAELELRTAITTACSAEFAMLIRSVFPPRLWQSARAMCQSICAALKYTSASVYLAAAMAASPGYTPCFRSLATT